MIVNLTKKVIIYTEVTNFGKLH